MGGLGAIEQDVRFDWVAASDLATELRAAAFELTTQATERETLRVTARETWAGRFGDEFDGRVATCVSDAWRFVGSLSAAATALDELAALAQAEQDRRVEAREWVAAQDDDDGGLFGGVPVVGDIEDGLRDGADWVHDRFAGEEVPPEMAEISPPTAVSLEPPSVVFRNEPAAAPVAGYGTGGVSSADPSALDAWASGSRGLDSTLVTRQGTLSTAHSDFVGTLGWGSFDASSLIGAVGTWVCYNETDAQWVTTIASTFREKGSGVVPDAVIQSSLNDVGLGGSRAGVTYDDAIAYGLPPTSGYADDPVNTASGNFVLAEIDTPGFARIYNSRSTRVGPFGVGWGSWASVRLRAEPDGAHWVGPDGQEAVIPRTADGYQRVAGIPGTVTATGDGLVLAGLADASRMVFDADGLLVSASNGPGTEVVFGYDDDGRLVSIVDGGRTTTLTWDGDRVVELAAPSRTVTYRYTDGHLVEASGRRYDLDGDGRITAVTDADGVVEVRNTYDDEGRIVAQVSAHGRETRYRYLPGRVTTVSDDTGGPVNHYVHDDHGRLVGVIDGHGNELRKVYDTWGNPTQVVERDGSTVAQQWDDRGRLVRRQLPDGSSFAFTYDNQHRVLTSGATRFAYSGDERIPVEVTDPAGGVTRLQVSDGLVRRVLDPDGVELRFTYTHRDLVAITDGAGNRALIERDAAGRVTATVSPMGRRSEITYGPDGHPIARDGWRYSWSAAGRLLAVTDPAGARRDLRYGTDGEAEQITDELGHATTRRFDSLGNLVGIVLPDGAKWDFDYDKLSRLTSVNDPAGATWLREYDVVGRLVGSTDPAGVHRSIAIRDGRIGTVDDGLASVSFDYDTLGRATVHRRADGSEGRATYDGCGRITAVTDPAGGTTRYAYTPAGRLHTVTTPLGHETRHMYDRLGRRAATIDPLGHRWTYRYNGDGQVTQVVSPTGETTRYRYDDHGRLTAAGDVTYEHDPLGRVVLVTAADGGSRRYLRDERGLLQAVVDPNGGVTRYERDVRGLLRTVVDPLGGRVTHTYDLRGRLTARTDQLGRTTRWDYDPAGRVIRRVLPTGEEVRRWYDASGRVTATGVGDEQRIRYTRDALGRAVAIDEPGFHHTLTWDPLGRLTAKSRNGLTLAWRYDSDGRRVALGYPDGTETTYTHDAAGRLTAAHHPGLGDVTFTHDADGRLLERRSAWGSERWQYRDGWLSSHFAAGHATSLTRDAAGRVTSATTDGLTTTFTYDPAGQLTAAGSRSFRYDAAGRLVAESGPDGSDSVSYTYDAAHQLVSAGGAAVTHDAAGRRTADGTHTYGWDWLGRLASVDDTHLAVDALGDLADVDGRPLLWDPATPIPQLRWLDGDKLIGATTPWSTITRDGHVTWHPHNWQGSAVPTDPWGTPTTSGTDLPVALAHRSELDIEGLLWLRNRPYSPTTRTFLTPDPLPTTHPYGYAANDPINLGDPLGLRPLDEAAFASYREAAASSGVLDHMDAAWDATTGWVGDNWEYIVAGAMVVGGVAIMATGVGGPIGAAMIGGALLGGGISAGSQRALTGSVSWRQVGIDAALGAAGGGAGAWAGGASAAWSTTARVGTQLAVNTGVDVTGGMANRALNGQNPFDPQQIGLDTLTGATTAGLDVLPSLRGTTIDPPPVDPTPPGLVYRGENRGPEVILEEGFQAKGQNYDLPEHAAFNPPDSGYVSTSLSRNVASGFPHGKAPYVYEINRPPGGIDVNATLGSQSPFPEEMEVAFRDRIDASNIRGYWTAADEWFPNEGFTE